MELGSGTDLGFYSMLGFSRKESQHNKNLRNLSDSGKLYSFLEIRGPDPVFILFRWIQIRILVKMNLIRNPRTV